MDYKIKIDMVKRILKDKKNLCIFVGAGASIKEPSSLPSFQALNDEILLNLYQSDMTRHVTEKYITDVHIKPEQLLQILWDYTNGYLNPVECFQYAQPNINHYLIAQLILEGAKCIVTPNFDPCIEKAMDIKNISYDLYNRVPSTKEEADHILNAIKLKKTVLWKPHGDCREKETLCYTRTKVAKLSNSSYLREIFAYIIENYNMLFLGYSGYDDDFYPILYQNIKDSQKHIIWNAYTKPDDLSPCISLKKNATDNFHIWVGDMTELLLNFTNDTIVKEEIRNQIDWKKYIRDQFKAIKTSKKVSMLAKYFNDYGLYEESIKLWKEGLELPEEEIDDEDKIRFQLNLGVMSEENAYNYAISHAYYYIAEIALQRIILSANKSDSQKAQKYLNTYHMNCQNKKASKYFKMGKYYSLIYEYKRENVCLDDVKLKNDFEIAYHKLIKDGEITCALELLVKYYGGLAAQNLGNNSLLQELINKSQQLIPYGEKRMIAFVYYNIVNMALTLNEENIARIYHEKCIHLVQLCRSMKTFEDNQFYEIMADLYHQKAILALSKKEALQAEKNAVEYADKISVWERKTYLKGFYYSGLCSIYMYTDYSLAKKYGEIAMNLCKLVDNKQALARILTYLAVADAMNHNRTMAIEKFKIAYRLHIQINEGIDFFLDCLRECNISKNDIIVDN